MKIHMVENFSRSAKAPQMSAGVMIKNMPWKHMKIEVGKVPVAGVTISPSTKEGVTPAKKM